MTPEIELKIADSDSPVPLRVDSDSPVPLRVVDFVRGDRGSGSLTEEVKQALLQMAEHVAYIDEHGQTYYQDLYDALYPPVGLNSISALFQPGSAVIYDSMVLDDFKQYLTVTAFYSDGTTEILESTDYTLSGSVEAGQQTITVSYGGKTATFNVTVVAWLVSIDAVFTQGNRTIFSNDDVESLRDYLDVTATYADESTAVVADYTLSGSLTAGTSTIIVTAGSATDTFDVVVTAFVIPEGYTRYDYIRRKTPASSGTVALSNFIFLNAYQDASVLSLEARIGKTDAATDNAGWFGARNNASGNISCSLYYGDTNGLNPVWRGVGTSSPTGSLFPSADTPVKLEIINPSTAPYYVKVNGETVAQGSWETSPVISSKFLLFNNVWDTATNKFAINKSAEIGDMIFRKSDGECVGYYVPCVYDGKIGMYDVVSESFYTATTASAVTIANSGCYYAVANW